jgi:hypothetical protein
MATNTLGGINLAQIAQDSLDFLGHKFLPLRSFARDFSTDIAQEGETVTTRIVSGYTAQDLSSGYASAAQNSTTTAITVTLNQFKGVPVEFTDLEITKAGDLDWLRNQFVAPVLDAVLDDVMQYLFGLCLTANFTNETDTLAANFDSDDLADIGGALTTLKVPYSERSAILLPTFYTNLIKDAVLEDASASGSTDAIIEGTFKRARGFNLYEYPSVPDLGAENLRGVMLHPSALAMASRTIADPTDENLGAPLQVENVIEPMTGLPLQYRYWYSPDTGKAYFSVGLLYGASVGQANSMHRIVDNV